MTLFLIIGWFVVVAASLKGAEIVLRKANKL
jgi:hypothetical protein